MLHVDAAFPSYSCLVVYHSPCYLILCAMLSYTHAGCYIGWSVGTHHPKLLLGSILNFFWGGRGPLHPNKSVWGSAPPENFFDFTTSEITSETTYTNDKLHSYYNGYSI